MDLDDLMKPKKPTGVMLGESLAALSTCDLQARLALIEAERTRVEAEIIARGQSRDAADAMFKR